ncbi:hypothetical protein BATDEDRAFT_90258 [Batrachochytrium dendrobatidis JAM81]|uniref:SAP domain-containing protein n=2 Tax=Batrachochytrium dendrobatidis TaxID=109871 RepID=F4P6J5_BATDJ|nr:uncharacterized protein BATDEDRAFT_90258 [Batrachochytrium dendrobatidis JAM81]EGF78807.1 hypothetical protein BATDEDRAFT_90258 [Batrachochytrium dendrobatidis JAM81]KAK5670243.1 hypothetical protein QVD99_003258 [Batrachochytrium dendrobatidis]OAJ45464.1 hypothetical protein BDEG_28603 [Batrachochytrium dendrobatidis JEL423]|eukprot:XP_006680461.1 hypothetical protein BATDEDRAFT_90258 [Batrachochytrium dendrobatidis JAM81]
MKLVDILFVLSAAATANAILIPADNDGSPQASSTSSQVSVSTNEPNPGTSNEYQQESMDLSIHNRIQQRPMYQPNPNTPGPNQRPTVIVFGPNVLKQGRKRIIDLTTSDQDQQQPTDVAGPSTPKRGQTQPIDQPSPSTSNQNQQQPMDKVEPGNTASNQVTELSEKDQKTFDSLKQKLVASKELRNKKRKEYYGSMALGFKQWSVLEKGEQISGLRYDPKVEKQLKQEYEAAGIKVTGTRRNLKRFMRKHGLEFEEPNSDSDSD